MTLHVSRLPRRFLPRALVLEFLGGCIVYAYQAVGSQSHEGQSPFRNSQFILILQCAFVFRAQVGSCQKTLQ
jgi:hypothetical protein